MIPIYVINLKKDVQKMSHMNMQLDRLNLQYKRVEAVDGLSISSKTSCINSNKFKLNYKRVLKVGEVGCAESHRKVWREIVRKNINSLVLILEDDVILPQNLNEIIDLVTEKTQLDLINLCSSMNYNLDRKSLSILKARKIYSRPYFRSKKIWRNLESANHKIYSFESYNDINVFECGIMPPLSSGYLINVRACKNLLSISQDMACPIDNIWNFTLAKMRQGFVDPVIIKQDSEIKSSIGDRSERIRLSIIEQLSRQFLKTRKTLNLVRQFRLYGLKYFI